MTAEHKMYYFEHFQTTHPPSEESEARHVDLATNIRRPLLRQLRVTSLRNQSEARA